MTLNDVRGVVGDGGDRLEVLVDKTVLSGDIVFIVDDGRVGGLNDKVVKIVTGELLGGNVSKDVEEGLVVDEGGRRARDEDRSRGGGCTAGVSRGQDVPGVVGTVEKVLNLLGGGGKVGCVDVVNR